MGGQGKKLEYKLKERIYLKKDQRKIRIRNMVSKMNVIEKGSRNENDIKVNYEVI